MKNKISYIQTCIFMHFSIRSSKENRILYIHSSKIIKKKQTFIHSYIHSSKITKQKKIKFHAFIYAFFKKEQNQKIHIQTNFMYFNMHS